MQIRIASVKVLDQEHALAFYTEKLGFVKHADMPVGAGYRWLTVTSPDGAQGVELALEPTGFEPAKVYQKALFDAGVPATAFLTDRQLVLEAMRRGNGALWTTAVSLALYVAFMLLKWLEPGLTQQLAQQLMDLFR